MKRTYQPHKIARLRTHGFRARMATAGGRKVIQNRRRKGRARLAVGVYKKLAGMSPRERQRALPGRDAGELPDSPARSPFCFPRSRHVRKRAEFLAVQSRGARVTTPHFVLLLAPHPGPPRASRLGITASRQVGNAIARNRAKRLVRETFRRAGDLLPDGVDLVVIVRAGADALGLAAVTAEWDKVRGLLKKRAADVLRAPKPA